MRMCLCGVLYSIGCNFIILSVKLYVSDYFSVFFRRSGGKDDIDRVRGYL